MLILTALIKTGIHFLPFVIMRNGFSKPPKRNSQAPISISQPLLNEHLKLQATLTTMEAGSEKAVKVFEKMSANRMLLHDLLRGHAFFSARPRAVLQCSRYDFWVDILDAYRNVQARAKRGRSYNHLPRYTFTRITPDECDHSWRRKGQVAAEAEKFSPPRRPTQVLPQRWCQRNPTVYAMQRPRRGHLET